MNTIKIELNEQELNLVIDSIETRIKFIDRMLEDTSDMPKICIDEYNADSFQLKCMLQNYMVIKENMDYGTR